MAGLNSPFLLISKKDNQYKKIKDNFVENNFDEWNRMESFLFPLINLFLAINKNGKVHIKVYAPRQCMLQILNAFEKF